MGTSKESVFKNKSECCGCGACVNICPRKAIELCEDEYGYVYPKINKEKCIGCNLCEKVCLYKNENNLNKNKICFAAVAQDDNITLNSASGGLFYIIAKECLKNDFVCYGCEMKFVESKPIVNHSRIDNLSDLKKLQGSKYVQSDTSTIFTEVKNDLNNEKKVLFSGTPCQVASLKNYLTALKISNIKNLYTIDLICHGVPSKSMFDDYIGSIYKGYNKCNFKFRDKTEGWGLLGKIELEKNNKISYKKIYPKLSSYYTLFLNTEIFRESCYNCRFSNKDRVGDITLGDYWGFEKLYPEVVKNDEHFSKSKGISCLILNTDNGYELLDFIKDYTYLKETPYDNIIKYNQNLIKSSIKGKNRDSVLEMYKDSKDFSNINKWYKKSLGYKYFIYKLWFVLPPKIRNIIKRK